MGNVCPIVKNDAPDVGIEAAVKSFLQKINIYVFTYFFLDIFYKGIII